MANVWNVYGTLPLLLFAFLAASVALLVHAAMVVCLINVARYNRDSERKAEAASHLVAAMQARLAQSAGAAETGAGADADTPCVRIPTKRTSASLAVRRGSIEQSNRASAHLADAERIIAKTRNSRENRVFGPIMHPPKRTPCAAAPRPADHVAGLFSLIWRAPSINDTIAITYKTEQQTR